MAKVPDRANMRQRYWVTTGDLGSFDNRRRDHNLSSHQGRAAMRREVHSLSKATGKPAWSVRDKDFGGQNPRDNSRAIYKTEGK